MTGWYGHVCGTRDINTGIVKEKAEKPSVNWLNDATSWRTKDELSPEADIYSIIATQTIQVHTIEKCPTVVTETYVTISECLSKTVPVEYCKSHICVRNLL